MMVNQAEEMGRRAAGGGATQGFAIQRVSTKTGTRSARQCVGSGLVWWNSGMQFGKSRFKVNDIGQPQGAEQGGLAWQAGGDTKRGAQFVGVQSQPVRDGVGGLLTACQAGREQGQKQGPGIALATSFAWVWNAGKHIVQAGILRVVHRCLLW